MNVSYENSTSENAALDLMLAASSPGPHFSKLFALASSNSTVLF
jgi:hypothetical protein